MVATMAEDWMAPRMETGVCLRWWLLVATFSQAQGAATAEAWMPGRALSEGFNRALIGRSPAR